MHDKPLLSRREWLTKGFKTAAALGLAGIALNAAGDLTPFAANAMNDLTSGALNFSGEDACVLTCSQTLGPCYYSTGLTRRNITEGQPGLPLRLGFRIVNADTCQPIQNAAIDLWHTNNNGLYSAPISNMCNGGNQEAAAARFARGIQLTDANGWAYFDTIFPGWYSGRVTHIHATVRLNNTSIVTTQFYFWDKVAETIYRNHPNYNHRPNRDRVNTTDNILGGNLTRMMPYILNTRLVNNKYLTAVKTLAIRTTATNCSA